MVVHTRLTKQMLCDGKVIGQPTYCEFMRCNLLTPI